MVNHALIPSYLKKTLFFISKTYKIYYYYCYEKKKRFIVSEPV